MSFRQRIKGLSLIFSITVSLIGLLVLVGWMGDITLFKSISPHWQSLKANAALCFFLAGIILILVNREEKRAPAKWLVSIFSLCIFLIGAVTLLEYIFSFNPGIDELFFKDSTGQFPETPPGRQSPFSAIYFMLFGLCYFPPVYKRISVSIMQLLQIISGVFVLASALSYVLGEYIIAGISLTYILVVHSTISFLLLITAVLFSQPDKGYMELVSSNTVGGKIIRKYLPAFILIFITIGWLGLRGEQTGLFNKVFSVSLLIIIMVIIFSFSLIAGSATLTKSEIILNQSKEQLLHSNKTLKAAEKMAKLGSWEYNMNGHEGFWSDQIFKLLDLPISEKAPSFNEFLGLIHPDERKPAQEIFDKMVDGIEIEDKIFRTNPERGPVKYLLLDWHVVKDPCGKPEKYFGTLQCVTDKVKSMQELKKREELFATTFHSKVFGLAIVNKERRVVDINETLTGLLGYRREDFIGKTSAEIGFTNPEYIMKRDELLQIMFKKGKIENYELDLVTRHGKELSLLLSVESLPLKGDPHWLIYLKDITEKRKAEKELAESEYRLRTILETEPECIKVIDSNGELTYINPAGLAMMEADHFDQVKGRKGLDTIREAYIKEYCRLVTNVFSGTPGKMQYEIKGLKGAERWLETHMVPLKNAEEKIISLISVTRDISESKKAEEQIRSYNEQLRMLAANLQNIREEERIRIGREIHDELGQRLTILRLEIDRVMSSSNSEKNFNSIAGEMLKQVDECIRSSRKISTDLRPSIIDDFGLIAALEWQAEELGNRTNIKSVFKTGIRQLILPPDYTIGIFRIFQESLTNVARHAGATVVTTMLNIHQGDILLSISDNGKGFELKTLGTKKHSG